MPAELRLAAYEPPIIADAVLRQRLIDWFRDHARAWERQADGCRLWGTEAGADALLGKATVAEEFARGLEQAVASYPQAWRAFLKEGPR